MNYYMYIPDKDNNEPMGSSNRSIYKDIKQYKRTKFYMNHKKLKNKIVVQTFYDFYDQESFKTIEG